MMDHMPGKAGAEGTRYVCPQCFTVHYQNDVLFASRRLSGFCDRRQAAYRRALEPASAFTRWCREGKTAALLNWRALPQSRRRWEGGVITAVRDLDGGWADQRLCPCCHMPLSAPCPVVVGWDRTGMDSEAASDLLYFAAEMAPDRWKVRCDGSLPLRYDYLVNSSGAVVLRVPVKPERVEGGYGAGYRRRCCGSASGAVVRLRLRVNEDGGLEDIEAVRTLDAMLEAFGYSGIELKMSAVFLLEGLEDRPDGVELFQRECPQLVRLIQYDFEDSCFAAAGHNWGPEAAVQAVEWLSGHVKCLNAGE